MSKGYYANRSGKDEHVKIAEKVLGRPLPYGAQVHHLDGNGRNNAHSNLVICPDQAYHRLLHKRTEAMEACGNPNYRKCSYCKGWDDTQNLMLRTKSTHAEGQWMHRACKNDYQRKYYLKNLKQDATE